jgi:acyl-CoA thioester hydrolase
MNGAAAGAAPDVALRQLPDHAIEMRWSDLDVLDHVNNVVYLEYVDDARAALVPELGADLLLGTCDIEYLQSLELTARPVLVTSRLAGEVLEQEVVVDHPAGRTVHARVRSTLVDRRAPITPLHTSWRSTRLRVRTRDMTGDAVGNAAAFGLFQEARILSLGRREAAYPGGRIVVARSSVSHAAAIPMRDEPYEVRSVIERMGRASVTMRLQLVDDDRVLAEARSVFVAYDSDTKQSRAFDEAEREYMLDHTPMAPQEVST